MQAALPVSEAALSNTKASTLVPALLAAVFGFFRVWGVGFSDVSAVHNAAHDVRHSSAFPCH